MHMKFRVKVVSKGCYKIQWRYWWWPFWEDEGISFSYLEHALRYAADLRAAQKGKP